MRGPSGLGASRLARAGCIASFTPRFTKHENGLSRSPAVRHFLWGERGPPDVFHESRITAFLVHGGTEALQSCFFRPGLLGNSSRRRSPCGSRIRASQAFTSRKPLILRSLRNTNHETRVTAVMFFTNHESRNTTQGLCVFHESRMSNRCLLVLKPFSLFFPARAA